MKKSIGKFQTTTIDLLRHGECEGGDIFRGRTDVALSELGWAQMRSSVEGRRLSGGELPWRQIVSSPLQRCARFAESLSTENNIPLQIHDNLQEMHFGRWEGRQVKEVVACESNEVKRFYRQPDLYSAPDGETLSALQSRVLSVWRETLDNHFESHSLFIFHGAAMRALMTALLQMPLSAFTRIDIPFAGFFRFHIYTDELGHRPALCAS